MHAENHPDDRDLLEQKVSSQRAFDGVLLHVNVDQVRLPNGGLAIREYAVHSGAAMIIPLFDDGTILLERQFRYPIGQVMIEFPAGKLDPDEDPLDCARRELLEETGYYAHQLRYLTRIHPVISYSTERIEIFLATQLEQRQASLDEGEFLQTFRATLAELLQWIHAGKVTDVKTQIGAFWLEKFLNGQWPAIDDSAG